MIIKKITVENYLCYFGLKEFELSEGLNIILGENGEGKTKLFEALDWLFNGDNRDLELLVSAKALSEADESEAIPVRVAITVEQYEEIKVVSKSFLAKKLSDGSCSASNYTIVGVEENRAGERSQVDGKVLLDRIFPSELRRYSMFKGEEQLNIFKNDNALAILINSFSHSKYFEKYAEKGAFLREKAEKAVEDATRSDKKNQLEYKRLENEIARLLQERHKVTVFINNLEDQIVKTEEYVQEAEKYVDNATALETINTRIKNIEAQIAKKEDQIKENYTTALFDENLILVNFEKIHQEFAEKVTVFSNKKRELQTEFDRQIGKKEGKRELQAELSNNVLPLPIGVPSKAHMEEMLKDKICKVCNRPADENSAAYAFMMRRLEEYLKAQEPKDLEPDAEEVLFKNNYLYKLSSMRDSHEGNLSAIKKIKKDIKEWFEFNKERKLELEELNNKLQSEKEEKEKLIGNSVLGAEKLTDVLKNYNSWQRYIAAANKELLDYQNDLEKIGEELAFNIEEKDKIDIKTANTFLIKTRTILRDIETIFKETKERKFDEFIALLQEKSNRIFEIINTEAFTGTIVFKKDRSKKNVSIELQEGGRIFYKPNQSLLTSMHISILFAISELAFEYREESYPMIFDAPTSSFGETKTAEFLNLIYETNNQKILLLKDFIAKDEKVKNLMIKPEFQKVKRHKAFWIRLQRPFDKKVLNTINTEIVPL